jgi:hypothetical protein
MITASNDQLFRLCYFNLPNFSGISTEEISQKEDQKEEEEASALPRSRVCC